ncbi:MAG TPA: MMPL family transporter [Thermoanaerobaculia bacterium]|nr:MMPL family transporter [Thermoanaerobaculia bacterium]
MRHLALLEWFLGHSRTVLVFWGLLAAAAVPGLLRLGTDNSPRVYFVEGTESLARYGEYLAAFGGGEQVRLVASGEGLWTAEGLAWLGRLEEQAAAAPYAVDALGLAGHHRLLARLAGGGFPEPAEPAAWPPENPEAFRHRAAANPLDRNLGLVGPDGGVATVLVAIEPPDNDAEEAAVAALRELVADPPPGVEARAVGLPVMDLALDDSSREVGRVFFPLLVAFAVALLAASFRDLRGVVLTLLFVAAPEVVLLGAMGYLGVTLNLVLAVLPPLLFVIALATAVHLQVRFRDALEEGLRGAEAVRATYQDKGWAVFWTGITTLAGFGSLAVSRVGPVPALGVATAAGIALVTAAAFSLYPALLAAWGAPRGGAVRSRAFERTFRRLGRAWAEGAASRRWAVLAVAALAAGAALLGVPRLRVESNALTFLPEDHPARTGIEELEARGVGVAAGELFLTLPGESPDPNDPGFRRPDRLATLHALAGRLRELPDALGAVGAGDLLAEATAAAGPGGALGGLGGGLGSMLVAERALHDPRSRELLRAFVTDDGRAARVALFVPAGDHRRLEPLFARAEEAAREAFPEARATVTGQFPLVLETHRRLLATLGLSLGLTTLVVTAIFRFLLPSTRLTLLALAPSLWPVAMVVGIMGWSGVPLDTATVMVASVVLGLVVDYTIHALSHFRELAPRVGRREAVAGTLERTAPAFVLTGAILAAGFGVCALSDFSPTARFGAFSALAIALAVTADLVLLPALLGLTPRGVMDRLGRRSGPESTRDRTGEQQTPASIDTRSLRVPAGSAGSGASPRSSRQDP